MRTKANKKAKTDFLYNPNMPDYNKTAFAIKKAEKTRALIAKYGLPKSTKAKKAK